MDLPCSPRPARRSGFTVIEVLVAATILAMLAASVARVSVSLMGANRLAVRALTQSQATRRSIEVYRGIPFDSLDAAACPCKFAVNAAGVLNGPGATDTLVVLIQTGPNFKRIQTYVIRY